MLCIHRKASGIVKIVLNFVKWRRKIRKADPYHVGYVAKERGREST